MRSTFAERKMTVCTPVDADSISGHVPRPWLWKNANSAGGARLPLTGPFRWPGAAISNPVGIMSTPGDWTVLRATQIYVVASSKDGSGNVSHRLHALDLTQPGAELFLAARRLLRRHSRELAETAPGAR